jgi:Ni,Fe-hydrogenase III small subunit
MRWIKWKFLLKPSEPPMSLPRPSKARGARSIFLRHLDCGSCNGCELALHALETPFYDLQGQGIHFVASPRQADALIMTGPLTFNLESPALNTLLEMAQPRVIVLGDCAIDGGPFRDAYGVVPLDERPVALQEAIVAAIPGCPPEPHDILAALRAAIPHLTSSMRQR